MHMRRDRKHYNQQADYAGFDGGAGQDQPEALSGSKGALFGCPDCILPAPTCFDNSLIKTGRFDSFTSVNQSTAPSGPGYVRCPAS